MNRKVKDRIPQQIKAIRSSGLPDIDCFDQRIISKGTELV
jgi:hypothetical protein